MVCGGERHRMLRVPLGIVPQLITTGLRATLALSKLLVALTHSEPKSRAALGSSGREAAVKPSEQPSPAQVPLDSNGRLRSGPAEASRVAHFPNGDTALDWAIRENHAEIVELLEIASKQVRRVSA